MPCRVTVSYSVGTQLATKTQAMDGDLNVKQGSILSAGYDFTMPGNPSRGDGRLPGHDRELQRGKDLSA